MSPWILVMSALFLPVLSSGAATVPDKPLRVAVVTGGHAFDVPKFHRFFRNIHGVETYIQSLDDFAATPENDRDNKYDVILFYILYPGAPTDSGLPWYAGKPKSALLHLGEAKQGIIILHHALLCYPEWEPWRAITGLHYNENKFSYKYDQDIPVEIADSTHPVTRDFAPWTQHDEVYKTEEPDADSHILLTTRHPLSRRALAWTRRHRNARVFCLQFGNDGPVWKDDHFKTLVSRGITWTAGRN